MKKAQKNTRVIQLLALFLTLSMVISLLAAGQFLINATQPFEILMSLTRLTNPSGTTHIEADGGVFATASSLSIWSNNTQKEIAGGNRTPIAFNNAQTTGGWMPVSVAGVDNADAFQIRFSTAGYSDIRFTCTQKSTGSGPDKFQLAYSVGSPTGPYTLIPNSETGTNDIPAVPRIGNDTYAALQPTYTNFLLPAEMEDEGEVYLRVVFTGLTGLGTNGNTSINDIIISSGEIPVPANKAVLEELINEAELLTESDYTPASWAALSQALAEAQTVFADGNATQSEVDDAADALRSAINGLMSEHGYTTISDQGKLVHIGSYWVGNFDNLTSDGIGGFAEIVAFNPENGKMYVVSGANGCFDIVDISDLDGNSFTTLDYEAGNARFKRVTIGSLRTASGLGAAQLHDIVSVAVNTQYNVIALAVQASGMSDNGYIVLCDYDGNYVSHFTAGIQPDHVSVTPDGRYVLTADEGEPRTSGPSNNEANDPKGGVTILDMTTNTAVSVNFDAFDAKRAELVADGVLLSAGIAPSIDLEPEYITVSKDSKTAYVICQENNAIAVLDIENQEFTSIRALGFLDHSLPENALDARRDNAVNIQPEAGYYGAFQPDGIALFVGADGKEYIISANEGDHREWGGYTNYYEITPNAGRAITLASTDGLDGRDKVLFGTRTFSIWNAAAFSGNNPITPVFDSGSFFEVKTAELYPLYFNTSHDEVGNGFGYRFDRRSNRKGPEPEGAAVIQISGKTYALIGLERIGGIMMYDVTDPANATYFDYINPREFITNYSTGFANNKLHGSRGPEGIVGVEAGNSPTGAPLILVANEMSGNVDFFQLSGYVPQHTTCENTWSAWTVTTPATAATDGVETRMCLVCGVAETRTVPATGGDNPPENGENGSGGGGMTGGLGQLPPGFWSPSRPRTNPDEQGDSGQYNIYSIGDVNGDGMINASDALEILKALVGIIELDPIQKLATSSRGDGKFTATDALNILKYVAGVVDTL